MWSKISLRNRVYLLLAALLLTTVLGGLLMVWYTYRIQGRLTWIIENNISAYQIADGLEVSLVNQKGYVSYYFMDGNPAWLTQLGEYREIFHVKLEEAEKAAQTAPEKEVIRKIGREYQVYVKAKDQVISLYKEGRMDEGTALHPEVRESFFNILDYCAAYKALQKDKIIQTRAEHHVQANRLRGVAAGGICLELFLCVVLVLVLIKEILDPIGILALKTSLDGKETPPKDVIKALKNGVQGLMDDFNITHSLLEKSRENLLQAEKMALVGKLAAGMAHSIRNPFTSVKMRLFSLGRTLKLNAAQHEDFEVISIEIKHIDTIVENFLEFSRPPKLQLSTVSPSSVVDATLQLLSHRLNAYNVTAELDRKAPLPDVDADPEQIKEVMVNIMVNACEAMGQGGRIVVREKTADHASIGNAAVVEIEDNGPGIPASIIRKVFQPFYTTKDEGTGLGLSIAQRIIHEHNGVLEVDSEEGEGTVFTIVLPAKEPSWTPS